MGVRAAAFACDNFPLPGHPQDVFRAQGASCSDLVLTGSVWESGEEDLWSPCTWSEGSCLSSAKPLSVRGTWPWGLPGPWVGIPAGPALLCMATIRAAWQPHSYGNNGTSRCGNGSPKKTDHTSRRGTLTHPSSTARRLQSGARTNKPALLTHRRPKQPPGSFTTHPLGPAPSTRTLLRSVSLNICNITCDDDICREHVTTYYKTLVRSLLPRQVPIKIRQGNPFANSNIYFRDGDVIYAAKRGMRSAREKGWGIYVSKALEVRYLGGPALPQPARRCHVTTGAMTPPPHLHNTTS
ncbi:hypothetical protein Bbelb_128940 [Branchiostoma belcheri]|nr:hypothetical protein Bbelb_128940 [Branchiostoma belcheri]